MADGFTLAIEGDLAEQLERAAGKAGVDREDLARALIEQRLFDAADYVWINGDPRTVGVEEPTTAGRPWSEVKPEMMALLKAKLAARRCSPSSSQPLRSAISPS